MRWFSRPAGRAAAVFLAIGLGMFAFLLLSPLGKPSVEFTLTSSQPGFSQLFVADGDGAFTETRSSWQPVRSGSNTLRFPISALRGTIGDELRWDPSDAPGSMLVTGMHLRSTFIQVDLPLASLNPSLGMSAITPVPDGVEFVLESNDSQALFDADIRAFHQSNLRVLALTSALLALIAAGGTFLVARRRRDRGGPEHQISNRAVASTEPRSAAAVAVPTWVLIPAGLVVLLSVAMVLWGSSRTGVSWDERDGTTFLAEYFKSGWFLSRTFFVDGIPDAAHAVVYAPVASVFGHLLAFALGEESWLTPNFSSAAYEARHLSIALIALIGLIAVFASARLVLGTKRSAVLACAVLASIPLWVGHSMFNFKDIPPATGFALFTLGIIVLGRQPRSQRLNLPAAALLAAGLVIAVGSRPGIWIVLASVLLVTLGLWLGLERASVGLRDAAFTFGNRILSAVTGLIAGYLVLWIIYPTLFGDPYRSLVGSLASSADFPLNAVTLTAGQAMASPPPWFYVPLWFGAQLPVFVLVFAGVGTIVLATRVGRALATTTPLDRQSSGLIPVLLQASLVPLGVALLGANLFGGVRHILFVMPAIAILATAGVLLAIAYFKGKRKRLLVRTTWGFVVVGLLATSGAQVQLFPYNFAYFNPVAAVAPIDGNWDVDGWWLSGRELIEGVDTSTRIFCVESSARPVVDCAELAVLQPFLPPESNPQSATIDSPALHPNEYISLSRFNEPFLSDACTQLFAVQRPLFWRTITLSHADLCAATLPPYPARGLDFANAQRSDKALSWGWEPHLLWGWGEPAGEGVWSDQPSASVGFRLTDEAPSNPRTLNVTGTRLVPEGETRTVIFSINGSRIGEADFVTGMQPQEFEFVLPPNLIPTGEQDIIVEIEAPDLSDSSDSNGDTSDSPRGFRIDRLVLR